MRQERYAPSPVMGERAGIPSLGWCNSVKLTPLNRQKSLDELMSSPATVTSTT